MRKVDIRAKLAEIDHPVESFILGDFDMIGEYTAKKCRDRNSELYRAVGAFFRPNYERGLLIYALIRQFKISSFLEIGFGRGYGTFCAAKAMYDAGILDGKIVTVDPKFPKDNIKELSKIFPKEWFSLIKFCEGRSQDVLPKLEEKFDMIYVDGDHSYEAVKIDWELCKDKYNKFILFDDYHLPTNNEPGIECSRLIDQIEDPSKELIAGDRRVFGDDRRVPDEKIDYGQVLMTNPQFDAKNYLSVW